MLERTAVRKLQRVKGRLLPWGLQILPGGGWKTFPPVPWLVSRAKHSGVLDLFPQLVIALPKSPSAPSGGNFPGSHRLRPG